jgi:hypothetical protein
MAGASTSKAIYDLSFMAFVWSAFPAAVTSQPVRWCANEPTIVAPESCTLGAIGPEKPAAGLSQWEIARRLGINRRTVARLGRSDELPPRRRDAPMGRHLRPVELHHLWPGRCLRGCRSHPRR